LLAASGAGVLVFNEQGQRTCARLFGLGTVVLVGLAILGVASEPVGRLGTMRLLIPGLLFAVGPAGHHLALGFDQVRRWIGAPLPPLALLAGLAAAGWFLFPAQLRPWAEQFRQSQRLEIGLGEQRTELVETLKQYTSTEARILWEDRRLGRTGSRW